MSDTQYYEWKQDIDDALCMLHERLFNLEKKVALLEKNNARIKKTRKHLKVPWREVNENTRG